MSLKRIVLDGIGSIFGRGGWSDWQWRQRDRRGKAGASLSAPLLDPAAEEGGGRGGWSGMPPELLKELVKRVEQSDLAWLKQPGPQSGPIQCYIKRDKATSTYQLFLEVDSDNGKFLMAARKIRRLTHTEHVISISAGDISYNSVNYMGKLRSNFLGTKFAIYDGQLPYSGAVTSSGRSSRQFYSRKVSPKVPFGSYGVAHVAYELHMLGTRGPRRMCCTMHSIPASALEPTGFVPSYLDADYPLEESSSSMSLSRPLDHVTGDGKSMGSTRLTEISDDVGGKEGPLVLKNKPPKWHEKLQSWCLNFHGRATVASVKNFQLLAASGEPAVNNNAGAGTFHMGSGDHDKIILQFGRIGKDLFTMDYRYPLSAFQAFGICLTSFDTKLGCE